MFSCGNPVIKKLLNWRQSDTEDVWAEKAVESLMKKLKKRKDVIEDLERALSFPGLPSKCVTIPRSFNDILHIFHRRELPHVVYCRIWRWSDLRSHRELKPISMCQYPYSAIRREVCINPYHYQRVKSQELPPVLVPKFCEFDRPRSFKTTSEFVKPTIARNVTISSSGFTIYEATVDSQTIQPISWMGSVPRAASANPPNYYNDPPETPLPAYSESENALRFTKFSSNLDMETSRTNELVSVSYQEPLHWASISYYEFNIRIGNIFYCQSNSVNVNGLKNPSTASNIFCLGELTNVNRNFIIEKTRKFIGMGIVLTYVGGEVYIECLSKRPIFVQSLYFNYQNYFNLSTVCKIPPECSLKVFDNEEFANILSRSVNRGYNAVNELMKMCMIRISFVKGWGIEYYRQGVTSMPCWIEIHLQGPLQWIDKVLAEMEIAERCRGPCKAIES